MILSSVASRISGETNPLYKLRAELEAFGTPVLDLVGGNVSEHGIHFPSDLLEEILVRSARRCQIYRPDSKGQPAARKAISEYYAARGEKVDPDAIVLTPGTSISYWYGFKLLANEGDEILCPRPSYPLFDYIAALSGIRLIAYDLDEKRDWAIDLERLESSISVKTRAIVLISPHNPTGHVSSPAEILALAEIAARHRTALIVDEVFSEFLFAPGFLPSAIGTEAPLILTLNGFSKMFALPGFKLGWMIVTGAKETVKPALRALELISDTFLPVAEIAQAAVPWIFSAADDFLKMYVTEIRERWSVVSTLLGACKRCSFSSPRGGFYVTLRLNGMDEEHAAETLLRVGRLLAHPGHFYDMKPDHLVVSFVQEPAVAKDAYCRLSEILNRL